MECNHYRRVWVPLADLADLVYFSRNLLQELVLESIFPILSEGRVLFWEATLCLGIFNPAEMLRCEDIDDCALLLYGWLG